MTSYKIVIPKPAASDESGTEIKLYAADEIVNPTGDWQKQIMDGFVENGWAMEIKTVEPTEKLTVEAEVTVVENAVDESVEEAPKKKRGRPKKVQSED
jgi:hypothetical protein